MRLELFETHLLVLSYLVNTVPALAKDALINESLFPGIKNSPQMHYIPHPPHPKGWGGGGPWGGGGGGI